MLLQKLHLLDVEPLLVHGHIVETTKKLVLMKTNFC